MPDAESDTPHAWAVAKGDFGKTYSTLNDPRFPATEGGCIGAKNYTNPDCFYTSGVIHTAKLTGACVARSSSWTDCWRSIYPLTQEPGSRLPGSRLPGSRLPGSRPPDKTLSYCLHRAQTGNQVQLHCRR